jgi:hypothetical protein
MSDECDDIQHIPVKLKLRDKCGMCGRSRKEMAELERKLKTAVEALEFYNSHHAWNNYGQVANEDAGVTAAEALNEIRTTEGE